VRIAAPVKTTGGVVQRQVTQFQKAGQEDDEAEEDGPVFFLSRIPTIMCSVDSNLLLFILPYHCTKF